MVYTQEGRTALHLANSVELATLLLKQSANVHDNDKVCAGGCVCVKVIRAGSVGLVRGRWGMGYMYMCLWLCVSYVWPSVCDPNKHERTPCLTP